MKKITSPCLENITTPLQAHSQQWIFPASMILIMAVMVALPMPQMGKRFSLVAGEVFLGRKLVQIISNEIEWSYPAVEKTNGDQRKTPRKALKSSHLDFEEKFINSNNNKRRIMDYVDRKSNNRRGGCKP